MSFVDKLKSRLIEIKQVATDTATHIKDEFLADPDIAQERLDTCLRCPRLNTTTSTCKECGCFVHAKTKLTHSSCPLKKW